MGMLTCEQSCQQASRVRAGLLRLEPVRPCLPFTQPVSPPPCTTTTRTRKNTQSQLCAFFEREGLLKLEKKRDNLEIT